MSLVFSDTSTKRGLVQEYERECGFAYGEVSGNSSLLAEFVAGANLALDDFIALAISADGTWRFDDNNHGDFPIATTDLVSGQRDYQLISDEQGNAVLEIIGVECASPNGIFTALTPVDVPAGQDASSFFDGQNTTGTPTRYAKLGSSFFLDAIPNYNLDDGLKAYVNREGSYFTASDTTKKPGMPGIFHKYFFLKPAQTYARRNTLANRAAIDEEVLKLEGDEERGIVGSIQAHFSRRNRDVPTRLTAARHSTK